MSFSFKNISNLDIQKITIIEFLHRNLPYCYKQNNELSITL